MGPIVRAVMEQERYKVGHGDFWRNIAPLGFKRQTEYNTELREWCVMTGKATRMHMLYRDTRDYE